MPRPLLFESSTTRPHQRASMDGEPSVLVETLAADGQICLMLVASCPAIFCTRVKSVTTFFSPVATLYSVMVMPPPFGITYMTSGCVGCHCGSTPAPLRSSFLMSFSVWVSYRYQDWPRE